MCPRCGNVIDRDGHYCTDCVEKVRIYNFETRQFCREYNICPECRKEAVPNKEILCPECRAKRNNIRKPLTEEQKEKYSERFRAQQKTLYMERKQNGICTRCGKRKVSAGKAKCAICLAKDAQIHRLTREPKKDIREERVENGLCYRCGETRDRDGKMCMKCRDECAEYCMRGREANTYWKMDNKIVFQNVE